MPTDTREARLARRISDLYATDQQFANARPFETVATAIESSELRLPQIIQTVIDGYAHRPALGQRAVEFVIDAATGRTSAELLPVRHRHLPRAVEQGQLGRGRIDAVPCATR